MKTLLTPGSRVVMDYYDRAGLTPWLDKLGFNLVGYGCTTCIGNSGPLIPAVSAAIAEGDLAVCSVPAGNRNFEGRIHPETKLNYLASPPLVVAYALADAMDTNLTTDPLGTGSYGQPVWLRDIWPSQAEIGEVIASCLRPDMYTREYAHVFAGDERWRSLPVPAGDTIARDPPPTCADRRSSTDSSPTRDRWPTSTAAGCSPCSATRSPPTTSPPPGRSARFPGRPAPDRARGTAAGLQLLRIPARQPRGDDPRHLRQHPAPQPARPRHRGRLHPPSREEMTIYDAAQRYAAEGVPLLVIAGKEYGSGSSRDWAAKGTALLGVRAVLAASFERIHRSNLIGMGVLPLQFAPGEDAASLGLTSEEVFPSAAWPTPRRCRAPSPSPRPVPAAHVPHTE